MRPLSLLLPLLIHIIVLEAAKASSSSRASYNDNGIGFGVSHLQREERRRYANLPPTVFAPGGRLHGVERVAREAMLLYDDDDDDDDDKEEGRGMKTDAEEDGDGVIDEEDVSSCATFAICCRRRCYESNHSNNHIEGKERGDYEADDEFAVMVGIAPISPYLHREYDQYDDEDYQKNDSLKDSCSAFTVETGAIKNHKTTEGYYKSLVVNGNDDDQYESGISVSPLSILSPHLIIGTGGKSIDSAILLRRTIEMAADTYANENGGVDWFISHSLEGGTTTTGGEEENERLWTPKGGVASLDVSSLVRRVADMAQISTQSLGGRYGRMLSSSLLALGSRNPTNNFVADGHKNRVGNDKLDSTNDSPDNDALILWRVDPTGQFWRLDASAIGRGYSEVEKQLLRHVKEWKKNTNVVDTQQLEGSNHHFSEADQEDSTFLHNIDVRAYLGSLSVNDAVQLAVDCLVNGIMIRRNSMRKRSRRTSMFDSAAAERGNKIYKRGLEKRVRVLIIRSNANRNHHASFGRSNRPYVELLV